MPVPAYGASPEEWAYFADTLGLGEDLLHKCLKLTVVFPPPPYFVFVHVAAP